MEIKFQGRYDKALFYKAVSLANQSSRNRRWLQPVLLLLLAGVSIVLLVRLIVSGDVPGNASILAVVMIAAGFAARATLAPLFAARKMWANPALRDEMSGSVTPRGITYQLKVGVNEIPWRRFSRVRRVKNLVTLVTRDGLLVIFPQRFFVSDADWNKFNRLLETHLAAIT
jgi:hypothetical protein